MAVGWACVSIGPGLVDSAIYGLLRTAEKVLTHNRQATISSLLIHLGNTETITGTSAQHHLIKGSHEEDVMALTNILIPASHYH